jgi:hypothetical protein
MATTTGSAVMIPKTAAGAMDMAKAAAVTPMAGGGLVLSPLPLSGGRRKTRRLSKKVMKMMKSMSKAKLAKLMKGGVEAEEAVAEEPTEVAPTEGARRRRTKKGSKKSRKGSKKSRHAFLY